MIGDNFKCIIDVGNTEIRGIVGTYLPEKDEYKILAATSVETDGMEGGDIVNLKALSNKVKECVKILSEEIDALILSVDVVINAKGVKYYKKNAKIMFYDKDGKPLVRQVTAEDVLKVIEKAKKENFVENTVLVDVLVSSFILNDSDMPKEYKDDSQDLDEGKSCIESPIGMHCSSLKAYIIFAFMDYLRYKNITTVFKTAGLSLKNLILQPIALSKFLLNKDDKKYGTLLFHMGDCSSDFVFWNSSKIKCIENFKVGGRHFTSDLMTGLKIGSKKLAEDIKINQLDYNEEKSGGTIVIKDENSSRSVKKKAVLEEIVFPRAEDIFEKVENDFICPNLKEELRFIVLAGESSKLKGFKNLVEREFGVAVKRNDWAMDKVEILNNNSNISSKFHTALGALGYIVEKGELEGNVNIALSNNFFKNILNKIKFWR